MKDKNIDFSDIPELTDEYLSTLKKVEPRQFYKVVPVKEPCHILIDKDVLDFFGKGRKRGYQTRINHVLREYMNKHLDRAGVDCELQKKDSENGC